MRLYWISVIDAEGPWRYGISFHSSEVSNSVTACDQIEPGVLPAAAKDQKVAQGVPLLTKIPWVHNRVIISKCGSVDEAVFYVRKPIENNWSRTVLTRGGEEGGAGRPRTPVSYGYIYLYN
ncbi:MAG: hypothetical protein XD88_0900 [Methanocalculus sp. 52_23]|uniref:DUF1016 N-terminal domain-containing protein n=1 Tax=Methanocalculus sp. TaxID=2004547 RepID=UPI0007488EC4|nr:DUF1016 N-terminal domain-containing protein [Methanocalculus sp.]KUK70023.1 MAG: hypothetical protein XD88_0900 [Methanocalculus sp. 52_23]HIJ05866.1 DUF1016 domain-containing protein [Methanocalculus sp.]